MQAEVVEFETSVLGVWEWGLVRLGGGKGDRGLFPFGM